MLEIEWHCDKMIKDIMRSESSKMLEHIGKNDIRSLKTEKALSVAMSSLLEHHCFNKITVKDICEEALVSRATFYSHFIDKYDLLKVWLTQLKLDNINGGSSYEQIEETVNNFVHNNEKVIHNLICDASNETLGIIFDFILSASDLTGNKNEGKKANPKHVVLSSFYAGGMIYYLYWQIKNKFPPDVAPMNIYLYEIIKMFQDKNEN